MQKKTFKIDTMPMHTLSWWRSRRHQIDMDPPYQRRGRLWSETDKAYLVDSILNGYDVPKLYMADFTWGESSLNAKKLPYAIIDGKQRFEAILDFFDGKTVLNKDFIFLDDPDLVLDGLGYKDLKAQYPQVAEIFDEYNLLVMGVTAQSEEPIKELFVRLNRSKPLTGAEIRNAMSGPVPDIIREIAKHEFFTSSISFATRRGQDHNAAAKLLLFEFQRKPRETKKTSLDAFVREVDGQASEKVELSGRKVIDLLDEMQEIFLPKDRLLASAGQLPVYYWFVRSRKTKEYPYVREFLVRFEEERRENRKLVQSDSHDGPIDNQLVEYDQFNRNTNDLTSHEGRIDILESRFKLFSRSLQPKLFGPTIRSGAPKKRKARAK
jgi:hypothetical protein